MDGDQLKGLKYALLTAFVSGLAIFINRHFVGFYTDAYLYTTVKNGLVALVLISVLVATKKWHTLRGLGRRDWLKLTTIGVVGGSIPFLLFFKGLTLTTAARGAFIHKTMFIYVALLATVFLKEKLNLRHITAAAILLAGNLLLIGVNAYNLNAGDLLIFAATLLWAAETVISKNALKNIEPTVVACARMAFGSIVLLGFLAVRGQLGALTILTTAQLFAALTTSAILLAYVSAWYTGLKHIQASTATVVLLLGAPFTTLLSAVFLKAAMSTIELAGFTLLLTGVIAYVKLSTVTWQITQS
jgi:drug/metabolite transporter (DMT)-like permease